MEEQTTTVESTTQASPATETVSQGDYINDAFKSYFADPKKPTEKQVEMPKKEDGIKAQEPKTENDGKNPKEVSKEAKAAPPDPFEQTFVGESGEFDLEKLMGVSIDGLEFKGDTKEDAAPETKKSDIPQWKQEYEAEQKFSTNIRTARLGPLESVYNQVEKSDLPPEYKEPVLNALRQEYAKVDADIKQYLNERDQENQFRKRQEEMDKIRDDMKASGLPELAKTNAMAIINKLPGGDSKAKIDLYNRIMFGPDAGGELLMDMFAARYPDISKQPKEKQDAMKIRFINELQADGGRLQRHFNRAYRYLTADPKNLKRIFEQVSHKTETGIRENGDSAQKDPSGSVQRQPSTGKSNWDSYFSSPVTKTRI